MNMKKIENEVKTLWNTVRKINYTYYWYWIIARLRTVRAGKIERDIKIQLITTIINLLNFIN